LICAEVERQVLLTLHARIGRWLQTGGHLEEADRTLEAAALREAVEESGLAGLVLDPAPLLLSRHLVTCAGEPTFHLDVQFLARVPRAHAPTVSEESLDLRWFSHNGLPDVDDSVQDLVRAAGNRLGWH
jgi:8-oxo-dGTP pyrophosphatase MutT (NUDIX family)